MSASFYDLLKYAKTGIASPSMTHYDKLKALAMCKAGFPVKTLTGVPPLTFQSDGTPLTAWSITGNMTQTGTPTPTVPIQPEETGDRTANLWANFKDHSNYGVTITKHDDGLYFSGTSTQDGNFVVSGGLKAGVYTISANANRVPVDANTSCIQIYKANAISKYVTNANAVSGYTTFEISEDMNDVQFRIRVENGVNYDGFILRPMLNSGGTALPFEHFGYKIDISCGGQTYTSYLQEPIRKIGDYADIASAVGTVGTATRRIKKAVFNGTENWQYSRSGSNTRVFLQLESNCLSLSPAICTHFVYNADNIGYPRKSEFVINSVRSIIIGINGDNFADAAAFKQWLSDNYSAGTPVCIWYVLAEPQTETFTAPTITPTNGANVLTVGTTLPPSEVSITGHIKSN